MVHQYFLRQELGILLFKIAGMKLCSVNVSMMEILLCHRLPWINKVDTLKPETHYDYTNVLICDHLNLAMGIDHYQLRPSPKQTSCMSKDPKPITISILQSQEFPPPQPSHGPLIVKTILWCISYANTSISCYTRMYITQSTGITNMNPGNNVHVPMKSSDWY
jgi:hypothetical protein